MSAGKPTESDHGGGDCSESDSDIGLDISSESSFEDSIVEEYERQQKQKQLEAQAAKEGWCTLSLLGFVLTVSKSWIQKQYQLHAYF